MATYRDDRLGKTIYADDIKLLKVKGRRTPLSTAQNASLQLIKVDYSNLIAEIDRIDSDNIVTPSEKLVLKREWDALRASRATTLAKAEEYEIQHQTLYLEYSQAFDALSSVMGFILDPLKMDDDTDTSEQPDLSDLFELYYSKATLLDEQLFRYDTGMLSGLNYEVKLQILITPTINPVPLDGTPSVLSVSVFQEGHDKTMDYDDSCFTWVRLSERRDLDEAWNSAHSTPSKTLTVNVDDLVYGWASFMCIFQHYYSETMFIEKRGSVTISKEVPGPPGEDAYQTQVISQNGTVFRMGQNFSTTLEVKVWKGGEDITHLFSDADFRWRRSSNDTHSDALWNSAHYSTGGKTITITQDDAVGRSNFFCDLLTERS